MQTVFAFSESSGASISTKTSLAFLSPTRAVYRIAFVPMNINVNTLKNASLTYTKTHIKASLQNQDSSTRSLEFPAHGVSEKIVGVLGGGQLGRMICEAASQLAIKVAILDPMENCPASNLCHYHTVGNYDDSSTVEEFAKRCDVLTVEIEHVDAATLEKLEQQGVDCQPKASTIRIIQDKYLQKVHFSEHAIPMPEFGQMDDFEGAKRAADLFGYPLMIKTRRLAYDGRGNSVAKNEEEISSAVDALGGFSRGLYVEKWAPFVKELSVVVARGRDNSILCYPVVETIHRENICHIVKSPADVSSKVLNLATEIAYKAVSSLEGAGIFAVEMFLTADGQVLLNEVAPRPHNSGHHTIEACFTSQFEQHLRALIGLPLGDPSMKAPAAIMCNILGEDGGEPGFLLANQLIERALRVPGATVHWYDKPEIRKQRKMGHITLVGPSMGILDARLHAMLAEETKDDQPAVAPRVGIIMGSDTDLPVMKDAAKVLNEFNVPAEVRIVSAHWRPEMMCSYASSARERGIKVFIAGAGGAAHLPSMVAESTPLPVIAVPICASTLDGLDSLLSIDQKPGRGPVATVAINNATNAGLQAVRYLGISDTELQARMSQYQGDRRNEVLVKDDKLEKGGWDQNKFMLARLHAMLAEETKDDQPAVAPRVGIIMGSDSDLPVMKDAAKVLREFNVPVEVRTVSAHRTPEMMFSYALSARERGIKVIIAGAGGAAHLPGMVAALTSLPVIGVPVRTSTLDGLDSLLSIVQMPRGVPVGTVGINKATDAGVIAVRILGISDTELQARMDQY